MPKQKPDCAYRLASSDEWALAQETGVVPTREIDKRDGYLHLSTREQTLATARLYFADASDLLALEIPFSLVAAAMKFELAPNRGEEFPHLYDILRTDQVACAIRLERDGDSFIFGEAL